MTLPASDLISLLREQKKTVATAESCTGGLLGKLLTDVPGSSEAYVGGVISYTCPVKESLLGVSHQDLEEYGPVSKTVARQMAEGVRSRLGTDFGLATTGLAGPDGDGSGKPVGLVYVALAGNGWTICEELHLSGGRSAVRTAAAERALEILRDSLN